MERRRAYRQTARAEAAERTRQNIMEAAVRLWHARDIDDVTLAEVAEEAGCTVQTILRRFGSKEGVLNACLEERASGIEELRDEAPTGDLASSISVLLKHYEADGDAVVRTLELERKSPMARRIVEHGRAAHRAWCARVFAPALPPTRTKRHARRLDAFVAATDVYLWKLLRRDLGRTVEQTRTVLLELVEGLATGETAS